MNALLKSFLTSSAIVMIMTSTAPAVEVPQPFKDRGYIKVGMETNSPPMEFVDIESNKLVGFNVELVEAIATTLGLEVRFEEMDVPGMSPALDTGRIDMIGSHFNDIPERYRKMSFVDYLTTGPVFYTTRENTQIYTDPLQLCGKAVGAPEHTTYFRLIDEWSQNNCPADSQITIIGTKGLPDTQLQIRQGRLVAGAIGAEKISYWAKDQDNKFGGIGKPFHGQLYGFAFTHANEQLRDAVMLAMQDLVAKGDYDALLEKYGLTEQKLSPITIDGSK